MIRSAFLAAAGVLAVSCFACAQSPGSISMAPPPPFGAAVAVSGIPATCNPAAAAAFKSRIHYVTTPFAPAPGAGPVPVAPGFPNDGNDYAGDLTSAFCAGSGDFQAQLGTLDAVYVNAAQCPPGSTADCFEASWGWHQSQPKPGPNGRVIALSAALWTGPHRRMSYSQYETELTQTLLPGGGIAYAGAQSCAGRTCTPIDLFPTALLASLAHEMGHIGYEQLIEPLPDPTTFCNGSFYQYPPNTAKSAWKTPVHKPRDKAGLPWRHLLTLAKRDDLYKIGRWIDHHKNKPHIRDIDHPPGGGSAPPTDYDGLVNTAAPWASPFASLSPDEDFVETYKLKVLTTANPPLTAVTVTVPGAAPEDIVADYLAGSKPVLAAKVACVPVLF